MRMLVFALVVLAQAASAADSSAYPQGQSTPAASYYPTPGNTAAGSYYPTPGATSAASYYPTPGARPAASYYPTPGYRAAASSYPTPAATPAPAYGATPAYTPIPSVYKPYVPVATPEPQAPAQGDHSVHVSLDSTDHPTWGLQLRGGGALPLGGMSTDNGAGGTGGFDVIYMMTARASADLLGLYAAMPYTAAGGGGSSPLTVGGVAIKLDYEVFRVDELSVWLGAGGGYMACMRTDQIPNQPLSVPVTYHPASEGVDGVAVIVCGGVGYDLDAHWSANAEIDYLSLSLSGGTSDNVQAALANLFVKYLF
jgi:hypothetical protein